MDFDFTDLIKTSENTTKPSQRNYVMTSGDLNFDQILTTIRN